MNTVRILLGLMALVMTGLGCAEQTTRPVALGNLSAMEKAVSQRMQAEPIPLPAVTPYDANAAQREAYLEGFGKAWNWVASGNFLHGTFGAIVSDEIREPWNAGWKAGYDTAVSRWLELDKENNTPPCPSP